ncbi:MAG: hypothetical protein DRP85_00725 [Candidatus Makaraimicrobium thalassicum]|nr:MAG: hypothetical protein DRP85_00725 [Candidatus Omnitrophota bacterium]
MAEQNKNDNFDKTVANWHSMAKFLGDDFLLSRSEGGFSIARRLSGNSFQESIFSRSHDDIKTKIKRCRDAYENVGIIGNVIDIMTDFALEGFTITHESESAERLFKRWMEKVRLYDVVEEILRGIYRDGNVPILTYFADIDSDELKRLRKVFGGMFFEDDDESFGVPYRFIVLDVLRLNIERANIFGDRTYSYQLDVEDVKSTLNSKDPRTKQLLQNLKSRMTRQEWENFVKRGLYPLNARNLSIIYYKKDSYADWATPMLWRVMDDLKFKQTLRNMDISIAESIQNAVQIFKIGDTRAGLVPTKERFEKLTQMLMNPSKSKTIVWDDLISIESDYPDTGKILGDAKYQQVNADILAGLGISEVLIGGPGGNYANSFLSCRTLLERLETGRRKVLEWLNKQLWYLAKASGLRKMPVVKFTHMSLRDERAEKQLLLELVDRNVISYRTLLERFGEDLDVEIKRMKREDKIREKLDTRYSHTLKKVGKFGPVARDVDTLDYYFKDYEDPDIKLAEEPEEENLPSMQGPQGEKGGRPKKVSEEPEQQKVEREAKPKGMGKVKEVYKVYSQIKNKELNRIAKARGCDINNLTEKDRELASDVAMRVMARYTSLEEVDLDEVDAVIYYKTQAPAILDRCVRKVYKQLVDRFKQRYKRDPNEKEKDKLRSSAWAICVSTLKKAGKI